VRINRGIASLVPLLVATLLGGCASGGGGPSNVTPPPQSTSSQTSTVPSRCQGLVGIGLFFCSSSSGNIGSFGTPSDSVVVGFTSWRSEPLQEWFDVPANAITIPLAPGPVLTTAPTERSAVVGADYDNSFPGTRPLQNLHLYIGTSTIFFFSTTATVSSLDNGAIDVMVKNTSPAGSIADVAMAGNPFALGWNYQSFGIWNDLSTQSIYAASYGSVAPVTGIPVTGQASFTGKLGGMYFSETAATALATANLTVSVDFSARTLSFSSTGTRISLPGLPFSGSFSPLLDITGTLAYATGNNSFSGTLKNVGGTMSGTSSGRFYGPTAQELGGTFALRSQTTPETFIGGYGAKR
jgi:hypothetical protein